MSPLSKEEKKKYNKEYYRKKKAEKEGINYRDKLELYELLNKRHIGGGLTSVELNRLEFLRKRFESTVDSDMSLYNAVENRVIGGGGGEPSGSVEPIGEPSDISAPFPELPEHLKGLSDEAMERIKSGESSLAFGRSGPNATYVDLNGNPVRKKEKEKPVWGEIVGG